MEPELGRVDGRGRVADALPALPEARLRKRIQRRGRHRCEREVVIEGRTFPAFFVLERREGRLFVHGRDDSRMHEKDAMLGGFSRMIDANNRQLRRQRQAVADLLDSMQQAAFSIDAKLCIAQPVSAHTETPLGPDIVGTSISDSLYGALEPAQGRLHPDLRRARPARAAALRHRGRHRGRAARGAGRRGEGGERPQPGPHPGDGRGRPRRAGGDVAAAWTALTEAEATALRLGEVPQQIHALFHGLHTLKGIARVLGLAAVASAAHHAEYAAESVRDGVNAGGAVEPADAEAIIERVLTLRRVVAEHGQLAHRVFGVADAFDEAVLAASGRAGDRARPGAGRG